MPKAPRHQARDDRTRRKRARRLSGPPGFHTSDTVEVLFVASGSCVMEPDDGATAELHTGDTLVQSGTRNAWRNPGSEPCRLVGMLAGAHRATS
ncbi:MAG TPA: cupin domain-containing protein [Thermoleophilaceae bacterium]|nr:cupin domain-containing protein [Thermoleophilaceae bacterium]